MAKVEPVIIGIASRDNFGLITSVYELSKLEGYIQRPVVMFVGQAGNIPQARNIVNRQVKDAYGVGTHWILWWDTDIGIPFQGRRALTEMIKWAEKNGKAITASYKSSRERNVLFKDRKAHGAERYTNEEIDKLPNYAEVGMAGFGMLYVPVETDYVFRSDLLEEDVNFWNDHPDLKVHYYSKLKLSHVKQVVLE